MRAPACLPWLTVVVAALAACHGGSSPDADADADDGALTGRSTKLTMQDVSVLFPLPNPEKLDLLLGLASKGGRGELLSKELWKQVLAHGRTAKHANLASFDESNHEYTDWKIVAMRFDPSFPRIPVGDASLASSRTQIRLVAQPLTIGNVRHSVDKMTKPADSAIHLVYDFPTSEAADIAKSLLALKDVQRVDPTGHPLGVSENLSSDQDTTYGLALKKWILDHCGTKALAGVAFTGFSDASNVGGGGLDQPNVWAFSIGIVDATKTKFNPIPLPFQSKSDVFFDHMNFTTKGLSFAPPSPRKENLELESKITKDPAAATRQDLETLVANSHVIDDPDRIQQSDVNCASCHFTVNARFDVREAASRSGAKVDPDQGATFTRLGGRFNLRHVADAKDGESYNVRNFGYAFSFSSTTFVGINQRVINETAAVVDFVNRRYLGIAEKDNQECSPPAGARMLVRGARVSVLSRSAPTRELTIDAVNGNAVSGTLKGPDDTSAFTAEVAADAGTVAGRWVNTADPRDEHQYAATWSCDRFVGTEKSETLGTNGNVELIVVPSTAPMVCRGVRGRLAYDLTSSAGASTLRVTQDGKEIASRVGKRLGQSAVLHGQAIKIAVDFPVPSGNRIYAYGTKDGYFLNHESIGDAIPLQCGSTDDPIWKRPSP